ncbi:MAG: bifunctional protein-serine/threonine kinase/phosphatase [Campylobacterota bacterium]|nr:bifunctional protein-serine/threonine kinase/phosphatase [Campylobacterota bacterium]
MLKIHASEYIRPKAEGIKGDDACAFKILDNELLIAVLCDGVGSARKGGAAARQTVKFFIDQFKARPLNWTIEQTLTSFTKHINRILHKESMTQYEEIALLTTLSVAVIEGDTLYTLNLGDSRIYLQDEYGLEQLSIDHNMDDGHMSHVLTQACGLSEDVTPEITVKKIKKGNRIILCSDGVYTLINHDELNEKINKGLSAKLIVNAITKEHKDNERDDAALQIFNVESLSQIPQLRNLKLPIPEKLQKGDSIDGYTLLEPLMAHQRIWKVKNEDTTLVMKFPMDAHDEQALDEFIKEAWYAKQIHHRSFGNAWIPENRSVRYYLMELIEGNNLETFLNGQRLSVDNAIALAKFLHKAEAHLLNLGLVHGDIKPENIIVYREADSAGTVFKMIDFGSVVEIFSTDSRAGTPSYLAPERFKGANINEATEIFSIGVTLYWALTGKYPYGEIEPFQTPKFKLPKAPSHYNKNIPNWFDSIILRAIAVDPNDRYTHYSEFFYELKSPENVKPYFKKDTPYIERHPLQFYKTAFFLLLGLNGIIMMALIS